MNELEFKMIEMYDKGMSPGNIAKELDTYPNKIRRLLQKQGKKLRDSSQAQTNALKTGSAKHPTAGKVRSKEDRIKISGGMMDFWDNMSDKEKERRAQIAKENWDSMSDEQRHKMNQLAFEAIRKAAKEGSKLERVILDALESEGYRIDFHNKNLIPMQRMEIDLYIPELKVIIEVDGPSHFFPIWGMDSLNKQIEFDSKKEGVLLSRGFVVIRIKAINTLSLKRKDDMLENILGHLSKIKKKFPPKSKRLIEIEA
jgi:very-short-patch-repair endonuclease